MALAFERPTRTIVSPLRSSSITELHASRKPNLWGSLLGRVDQSASTRQQLIDLLLDECASGGVKAKPDRQAIELLMDQLELQSPVKSTAASSQLQKTWQVVYTTEKEINFFLDAEISNEILQVIDGRSLRNVIPFVKGGSFSVNGRLEPDPQGVRTEFEFESAMLDLGRWGSYKLPPVGKGWFDTIYLDDNLRIDRNSRNDLLICKAVS